MAKLQVEVLQIEKVIEHPNADRLDLATVLGYQVVVGRGQYRVGDCAVYFPVDSIIPEQLQDVIFAGSKMKLTKSRVRAARIRGAMSFGLLVDIPKIKSYMVRKHDFTVPRWEIDEGSDLTDDLEVTKYEPPVKNSPQRNTQAAPKRHRHPDFKKYTDIQHLKRNLKAGEMYEGLVTVTEKIHGTNFRCGWVPYKPRTFAQKLKNIFLGFLGKQQKFEFVYGSHNVQLQDRSENHPTFYKTNIYARAVKDYSLRDAIKPGEVWYFEIYGDGIQKNYSYGLEYGQYCLAVIDVKKYYEFEDTGSKWEFLPWYLVRKIAKARGLQAAPTVKESLLFDMDKINWMLNGDKGTALRSFIDGVTPMEGFVVRPLMEESMTYAGRFVFKLISDEYLLNKSNSDFH